MDVTFQFELIKGRRIRWPRMEDAEDIMVAGSARPLVDAFRIAQVELIDWLVDDYGFDRLDAYQIVSQGGHTRIANVVDPNYTVVAKFPKRLLPPSASSLAGFLPPEGGSHGIPPRNPATECRQAGDPQTDALAVGDWELIYP